MRERRKRHRVEGEYGGADRGSIELERPTVLPVRELGSAA